MYLSRPVMHDKKPDVARNRLPREHYAMFSTIRRILWAEAEVDVLPSLAYRALAALSP